MTSFSQFEITPGITIYYNRLVFAVPVFALAPIFDVLAGRASWTTIPKDLNLSADARRIWGLQPSGADKSFMDSNLLSKY